MGRGPGDSGVEGDAVEHGGRPSAFHALGAAQRQVWENVRRALGKLVTHTRVQPLRVDGPLSTLASRNVLTIELPPETPGAIDVLLIPVTDYAGGIPHVDPGGGDVDLAAVATVVSANSALAASNAAVHGVDLDYSRVSIPELPAEVWSVQDADVFPLNTTVSQGDVYGVPLQLTRTAAIGALPVDPVIVRPGNHHGITRAFRPMRIPVLSSVTRAYSAPMTLRSSILRRGPGLNMEARERLAAAGKTAVENVALIGLFRNVPVTAVSRLSVEEERGELSIWLKPEAAHASAPPKTVSLLIGRDIATGKMIQTVA